MKKTLAVLAVLAVAAVAQAELLASWNFTGSSGTQWGGLEKINANTLGTGVASAWVTPNCTAYGTGKDSFRPTGAGWGDINRDLAANDASFIGVTLQAAQNYTLTVEDIQMNSIGSGTGLGGKARWSDGTQFISAEWTTANNTALPIALTTQPSGSTVELRLVASLTAGGGNWGFNGSAANATNKSLMINGKAVESTPAVPEPATMSLLGLGALAMVLRRKLRK